MLIYLQLIEDEAGKSKFRIIYENYKSLMYRAAYRVLQNPQDSEDALQEAFISIAKNISKVQQPLSPQTRAYVITITENKAIDIYRAKSNNQTMELDETYVGKSYDFGTESELVEAMKRLPDRYRQAIVLHFYSGYSAREIAALLGLNYDAARKLIYRAKSKLCSELEKDEIEI